jgi:hypothetical protein
MSTDSLSTSSIIQIRVHSAWTCSRFAPSRTFKRKSNSNLTHPLHTHPREGGQAGAVQSLIPLNALALPQNK